MQYMIEIGLGTPPQHVAVLVDTGSSDLWVKPERYSPTASSTHKLLGGRVEIVYGQGNVIGGLVQDELRFGSIGNLIIHNQSFLVPDHSQGMASIVADGVLGMAFPAMSHTGGTVLEHLQQANISSFSLFLTGTQVGSYLVLGPPDQSWFNLEQRVWLRAVTNMWWAFEGQLAVDGSVLASGIFLLDSGTSLIGAPPLLYQLLLARIVPTETLATCVTQLSGLVICPCEAIQTTKPIGIVAGGAIFPVRPADLFGKVVDLTGRLQCILQVMQLKPGMPFILGDTFLRTVAATFEPRGPDGLPRIGLAPLRGPRAASTEQPQASGRGADLMPRLSSRPSDYRTWACLAALCVSLLLVVGQRKALYACLSGWRSPAGSAAQARERAVGSEGHAAYCRL